MGEGLRDRFRQEEIEVLSRSSQVGNRDILSHLLLVVGVQDFKHLICLRGHLDSVEVDIFVSKLLNLLLNKPALRVSIRQRIG